MLLSAVSILPFCKKSKKYESSCSLALSNSSTVSTTFLPALARVIALVRIPSAIALSESPLTIAGTL